MTLQGAEPAVWRRLEVPADSTFDQLHRYINAAMGWLDYHLHEFRVGRRRIAASDADWETEWPHEDETQVTLGEALADGVRTFRYRYDFGDDWEHLVEVEHVGPPEQGVFYPWCVAAAGACPPEDCGGPHGYLELLEALADPEDPEHAELLQWLEEPLDPGYVDVEGIDRLLRLAATGEIRPDDLELLRGVGRRRGRGPLRRDSSVRPGVYHAQSRQAHARVGSGQEETAGATAGGRRGST